MELTNGQYHIGGISIMDITKEYGLPVYVYDGEKIKEQYHRLYSAIAVKKLTLNYACKALSNPNILKLIQSLGAGLDAVSLEEVKLGLNSGFDPADIMYTPNGVNLAEIEEVIALDVKINIDNLEMLEVLGSKYPGIALGIRINPHLVAGGNAKIQVGHIDSKFGISIHLMHRAKEIIKRYRIQLQGIHMHTGSDILDIEVFLNSVDILFNQARQFDDLDYVDFGSGFKVKYKPGDYETDIDAFGQGIREKYEIFTQEYGKEVNLIFEPGKYLVSEAGYFLVETNVVKHGINSVFVGVNSGMNHLIRPMFYDAYHEIVNLTNPHGEKHYYNVVGYICETDTFAYQRELNEVRIGDVLCFKNTGAYCMMMASNYNSRLLPAEVLLINGHHHLIRRRQTFDDMIQLVESPEINFTRKNENLTQSSMSKK